jgi:hypothetical protein
MVWGLLAHEGGKCQQKASVLARFEGCYLFKNASDVAGEKEGNPLLVAKQVRGVLKRLGMCWRGLGDRCI